MSSPLSGLSTGAEVNHRWGDKVAITPNKTERECLNGCNTVKVTRHEFEGGREVHWTEFRRGLDRFEGEGTPVCEPVLEVIAS